MSTPSLSPSDNGLRRVDWKPPQQEPWNFDTTEEDTTSSDVRLDGFV